MHDEKHSSGTGDPMERLSKLRALCAAPQRSESAISAWVKNLRFSRNARYDTRRSQKGGLDLDRKFRDHCKLRDGSPRYADKDFSLTLMRPASPELRRFYREQAAQTGFTYV